ncbi:bone morphogenetic protein 7-like isoform X1 [Hydra vulgaris]|uniref:Bone morphogenetic protein 7-like isoform X1 n=1 Tax=Hydra vulgaris TaxID=6087 RepID=A0ABM4DG61_HYDVU
MIWKLDAGFVYLFYTVRLILGQPLSKSSHGNIPVYAEVPGLGRLNDNENIPQYLRNLYKSLSSKNISGNLLHDGNVARSYNDLNTKSKSKTHHCLFNVSDIESQQETLKKAELRLFKSHYSKHRFQTGVLQVIVINIFNNKTVSSKKMSFYGYGWQVFPVTRVVQDWIDNRTHNRGLNILVQKLNGSSERFDLNFNNFYQHDSALITFTKEKKELSLLSLLKKNDLQPISGKNKISNNINDVVNRVRRSEEGRESKLCGVEPLVVPLELIDWHNLFIMPKSFSINQCKGQCFHKNDEDYLGQTSHSILQALYADVLQDDNVNYPCCAPTKFLPASAILNDRSSNREVYKLVQLENLQVTECECL